MKSIILKIFTLVVLLLMLEVNYAQTKSEKESTPFSYELQLSPLITNLKSSVYSNDETSLSFGYNFGGSLVYHFYSIEKFVFYTSLGLGITQYSSQRLADMNNELWTNDADNERVLISEELKAIDELQKLLYLDVPLKFGVDYNLTPKWKLYASLGLAYGINLNAKYTSTASVTRTGYYPSTNVLLYDIDISGSPYYYPTDADVEGEGSFDALGNFSVEGVLGARYSINNDITAFAGLKSMVGLKNIKETPAASEMVSSETTLNSLVYRDDNLFTRGIGVEFGLNMALKWQEPRALWNKIVSKKTTTVKASELPEDSLSPVDELVLVESFEGASLDSSSTDADPEESLQTTNLEKSDDREYINYSTMIIPEKGMSYDSIRAYFYEEDDLIDVVTPDSIGRIVASVPKTTEIDIIITAPGCDTIYHNVVSMEVDIEEDKLVLQEKGDDIEISVELDVLESDSISEIIIALKRDGVEIDRFALMDTTDFVLTVRSGKLYLLNVLINGYLPVLQEFDLEDTTKMVLTEAVVEVDDIIKSGLEFKFESIKFKTGSVELTKGACSFLDDLYYTLSGNEELKISVTGHTDHVGTDADNMILSNDRAQSVKDYFINKGLSPAQIETHGYGESQPIATNSTEEGKALNRRVEFKIL